MTAKILEARRSADLYIATGTPVAASLVISICDQLDEAKESINALTLALEVERDAANLYAKQVAHWIGKHDALLEQQLQCVPQEWNDKNVIAWCVARGIKAAQPVAQPLSEVQKFDIVTQWFTDESDITRAMQMLTDFEQTTPAHGIGSAR